MTADSLEGPGVAITVRFEVFWSQYGSGLKHLHEHHVTHHPEQTCTHRKTFSARQEMHHRCKTHLCAHSSVFLRSPLCKLLTHTHGITVYHSNTEEQSTSIVYIYYVYKVCGVVYSTFNTYCI